LGACLEAVVAVPWGLAVVLAPVGLKAVVVPLVFKFKAGVVVVVVPVGRGLEPLFPVRLRFKAGVVPVVYYYCGALGLKFGV
jgi:hypothetical protein